VFHGCIGPVRVGAGVRHSIERMLAALAADFGLRGLNGLDFLLDSERITVLELNPRPPASIDLYRDAFEGGLVRAHVAASLEGRLPDAVVPAGAGGPLRRHGFEIVFAQRRCEISDAAADALALRAWCHDLPAGGTRVARGEPLCTVSAAGRTVAEVEAQLLQRRRQISLLLEQVDEGNSEGSRNRTLERQ
jgi:predicted ATP-grasp superfamily ATP-dependent carboligase